MQTLGEIVVLSIVIFLVIMTVFGCVYTIKFFIDENTCEINYNVRDCTQVVNWVPTPKESR